MVTVTSLYIFISYIYTYAYNFYYLSSLHSYCMSIFSVTCSMSLAYLLFIPLLYSCFYTLHIPYSFYNLLLFISYHYFSDYVNFYHTFHISLMSVELILYYHIIYCHRFSHIFSWLYTIPFVMFYFHILLSCTIFIYCYHVLFMYCVHVLISYTVFLLYFSYYFLFHIHFVSLTLYFLYSYTCHHIAMLCFSFHVMYFYHFRIMCIYLSFVLCFIPA